MRIERSGEAEIGLQHPDIADHTIGQKPAQLPDGRDEAHPHGFHEEKPPGPGRGDHAFGLSGVQGEGLLAENGLARLQAHQRVRAMKIVRSADINDVDVGIGGQGLVAWVAAGNAMAGAEPFGSGGRP